MIKKGFLLVPVVLLFFGSSCERPGTKPVELAGFALGTTYSIKLSHLAPSIDREQVQTGIKTLLSDVEQSMSVFHPESEIARFNRSESSDWFRVSSDLYTVLSEALRISEISSGAFDPTLGGVIELWGFGKADPPKVVPRDAGIEKALLASGYHNLHLDEQSKSLRKEKPSLKLNLSAIAKGYAVDRVSLYLENRGMTDFLVEIGGEIRTNGNKQNGKPWVVAIERPEVSKRSIFKILEFGNASMATSGDYRNFYEIEGVRYSHTIDPETGRPSSNNIASVSVVYPSCMTSDALATALLVMGFEKGYRFAMEEGLAVLWIIRNKTGLVEKTTPGFKHKFSY